MKKLITLFSIICLLAFAVCSQAHAAGGFFVDAGQDVDGCPGDTLMLIASVSGGTPPITYSWSPVTNLTDPANDTTYVVVGATSIQYVIAVSDALANTDTDTVVVNSRGISVDVGPDQTIQCGNTVFLSAFAFGETSSVNFEWSNGENGFFLMNIPVGGYAVTATNSFGCSATDEVNVFQSSLGQDIAFLIPSFICADSSATLTNNSTEIDSLFGFPLLWTWDFGNGTSSNDKETAVITYDSVGTYLVTLTMTIGPCILSHSEYVQVQDCEVGNECVPDNSLTEPGLDPGQEDFNCADRGVYFDEIIQFVNFDTVEAFGDTITVNWIQVKSIYNLPCGLTWEMDRPDNFYLGAEQGCINIYGTTTDAVGQYPLEIFIDANISGFAPFPITLQNTQASLFGLGYNIRVKNAGELCWELDTGFVNYDSLIACSGGEDTLSVVLEDSVSICPGDSITLEAEAVGGNGPYTYRWSPADGLSCTFCSDPTIIPTTPTTYTVEVNDINGYLGSNTVYVGISEFEVDLGADTNLTCGQFNIDLVPLLSGDAAEPLSYAWSSGGSDSVENVEAGSYTVTVTNAFGCTAADDIVVTVDSALSFDAGDDTVYCDSTTRTVQLTPTILTNGSGNYVYTWIPATGLDDASIFMPMATINDDVTYSLTILDMNNNCEFTDSIHFEFFLLDVDAGDDINFDGTGTQTMNPTVDTIRASSSILKYTWAPTTGLSDHTIKNPLITSISGAQTVYTLTVSNLNNECSFSDTMTVFGPEGIEGIPLNAYASVYPNPNNGQFTVALNQLIGNEGEIRVFDIQGQLLETVMINSTALNYNLDLTNAAKGIYLLTIETPKGKAVKRLTVQ